MARNKIIYGNETLIDLSGDTAKESDVAQGKTFHKADGSQATGTATGGGTAITPSNSSPVALTEGNSYVIEDNDGYAIESYEDLTVNSSVKTVQSGKFYKPDKTGYISDCNDLDTSGFYIVKEKKFIGKNGSKYTGTRPSFYKYGSAGNITLLRCDIAFNPDVEYLPVEYIIMSNNSVDREVYLRITEKRIVQLVTHSDDYETEYTVNIVTLGVAYVDTFKIEDIQPIGINQFFITYAYDTSATARYGYTRLITIKNGGVLYQSIAFDHPGSWNPNTYDMKPAIMKLLSEDTNTYMFYYSKWTKSSDALVVYFAFMDVGLNGLLTGRGNSNTILYFVSQSIITGHLDIKNIAEYTLRFLSNNIKYSKGGYCYLDVNSNVHLHLFNGSRVNAMNYIISSTNCSDPESLTPYFNDVNDCCVIDVLGLTNDRFLVTAKRGIKNNAGYVEICIWKYDKATPYLKLYTHWVYNFHYWDSNKSINDIYIFLNDDIIYIMDSSANIAAKVYQIKNPDDIKYIDIQPICNIISGYLTNSYTSSSSDAFCGFYVNGD